jgi:hypothetical protein
LHSLSDRLDRQNGFRHRDLQQTYLDDAPGQQRTRDSQSVLNAKTYKIQL